MTVSMLFASTHNSNFTNSKLPTLNSSTATILKSDSFFFLQYGAHLHPNVTETQT